MRGGKSWASWRCCPRVLLTRSWGLRTERIKKVAEELVRESVGVFRRAGPVSNVSISFISGAYKFIMMMMMMM